MRLGGSYSRVEHPSLCPFTLSSDTQSIHRRPLYLNSMPPLSTSTDGMGLFRSVNASKATYLWRLQAQKRDESNTPHQHGPGTQFYTVMGIVAGVIIIGAQGRHTSHGFGCLSHQSLLVFTAVAASKLIRSHQEYLRREREQNLPINLPSAFSRCRIPSMIPLDALSGWGIRPLSHNIAEWLRERGFGSSRPPTMVQTDGDTQSVTGSTRRLVGHPPTSPRTSVGSESIVNEPPARPSVAHLQNEGTYHVYG